MPPIFRNHLGRLVNAQGVEVTVELAVMMAMGMSLGAYRTDIDQEIHAETPDGPVWTRTSVTFDFSDHWRVSDSPWTPPSGMPLEEAISCLIRGIGPLRVLENPIIGSPYPSANPSPSLGDDYESEAGDDYESAAGEDHESAAGDDNESAATSSSGSALLFSPFAQPIPRDDDICDVCLARCIIASPEDCDCVGERHIAYIRSLSLQGAPLVYSADAALAHSTDAALAHSLNVQGVASALQDVALMQDITGAQSF
ncbi:hypothetical protein HWV62_4557 [Athelia sp. TMB]|nr:hypothetical protein HWV62_4557 [Athelia sp. TMB]